MLGPSFVSGGQQDDGIQQGLPALRPAGQRQPRAGQSGGRHPVQDSGVGTIVETSSDDGHFMAVRGPITLRHMRFRLTDLEGQVVRLRGTFFSRHFSERPRTHR